MRQSDGPEITHWRRVAKPLLATCLLYTALGCLGLCSHARDLPEHQIKAAFIFNVAAFVNWPEDLFETSTSPLRYCVRGADAMGSTLAKLISGETLDGRPLELVSLDEESDVNGCHILFLGSEAVYDMLPQVTGNPNMLTVGDTEQFTQRGGMIALLRKRKRIHPVINLSVLEASVLRLSSKLLRLSTLVRPGGDR